MEKQERVMPYWGSCGYWRRHIAAATSANSLDEVGLQAQGHELTRTELADGTLLSVPVEGGYRRLRHALPTTELMMLRLSDHGRWQNVHLGMLKALFGKTPFFGHYFPAIAKAYSEARAPGLFSRFTAALTALFTPMLTGDALQPFLTLRQQKPHLFDELAEERMPFAPDNVTILQPLFNLGPELPFVLIN